MCEHLLNNHPKVEFKDCWTKRTKRKMSRIKILSDKLDTAVPKHVPKADELSNEIPRCRNTGKPPLPLTSSYSPQGKIGRK